MTTLEMPDAIDLRTTPELGSLALLDAALVVADQVLRREHADLDAILGRPGAERVPEAIVAFLLVQRMLELRSMLALYAAAVRRACGERGELPF